MPTTTTGVATEFINFTRASNATVTDSNGLIKWAPHNLLTNSESFDAAAWTKNSTVTANNAAAPNSTTTAELVDEGTASGYKQIGQNVTTLAGVNYTLSVFAKYVSCRWLNLSLFDNGSSTQYGAASFDLLNGVVGTSGVAGTGYAIVGSPTMTPLSGSGGWYLCSVTVTNGTSVANRFAFSPSDVSTIGLSGLNTYTGTSKTFQAWGAHLYRSDLAMQPNTSAYPMYNPTTVKNMVGYTEDFTNAYWTKSSTAALATSVANPNGLSSSVLVYPSSTGSDRLVYRTPSITGVASTPYTISVYAKAAGINFLYFGTLGGGTSPSSSLAYFDLQNGVRTQVGSAFTSATITSVGNGWYRCSAVATASLATLFPVFGLSDANNSVSVTASGTSGVYLWGAQLSDSASLDSYVPVYGAAVTSAAYYGPRRDFDPVTLACKGLLVEEQRTNTILNSSVFSGWTKATATVLDNQVAGPDGTVTAGVITATAANGEIYTQVTSTSGVAHAGSIYVKRKTGTGSVYLIDAAGGRILVTASISTGSWTRISVTANSVSVNPFFGIRLATSGDELYLYGAQLEAGSFATSYIPVGATTAGATRNADVASVSTQAFPYSQSDGTLVFNFGAMNFAGDMGGSAPYDVTIGIVTNGARFGRQFATQNANSWYVVNKTGTPYSSSAISGSTAFAPYNGPSAAHKLGIGISATDMAGVVNGGTVTTTAISSAPTGAADLLYINPKMNGHIRQITYLPRRISNTELQTRTA